MNVVEPRLRPQEYGRANYLKREVEHVRRYVVDAHLEGSAKANELCVWLEAAAAKIRADIGGDGGGVVGPVFGSQVGTLSAFNQKLVSGNGDINLLVIGDSTGDENTEWVHLLAESLAQEFPALSVTYRAWAGSAYGATSTLSTGTSGRKLIISNASVASTTPDYMAGARFATAVVSVPADLVIWNHGKNLSDKNLTDPQYRGAFTGPLDMVRNAHPDAVQLMIIQSPNRDSTLQEQSARVQTAIGTRSDLVVVDTYAQIMALGKPASLYIDDKHPSPAGSDLTRTAVFSIIKSHRPSAVAMPPPFSLSDRGNKLTNPEFANWSGSLPDGWALFTAGAACVKSTDNRYNSAPWSAKVTGLTGGSCIRQTLDARAAEFAGKIVSVGALVYVPSTVTGGGTGSVAIQGGSPTTTAFNVSAYTNVGAFGGWRWVYVSGYQLPTDLNQLRVACQASRTTNTDSEAYFASAFLVEGAL